MKEDYGATQAVKKYAPNLAWLMPFRNILTPSALWTAIVALALAIGYVVNAQNDIHRHQDSIMELQQERTQDRELLQSISMQLAVVNSKIGDIATEVDRQREWRERIESVAEEPTRVRKRR